MHQPSSIHPATSSQADDTADQDAQNIDRKDIDAPQEVELKLALGDGAEQALYDHPVLADFIPTHRRLANVYFDTPERDLERERIALRLRGDGERFVQTVKTAGSGRGGLHTRGEWETPVAGEALDAPWLSSLCLSPLDQPALIERLVPVYRTDFDRTCWQIEQESHHIELSLDVGEIVVGAQQVAIFELELELKRGDQKALWALADSLAEHCALRPANASKAARAAALRDGGRSLLRAEMADPGACLEHAIDALDLWQDTRLCEHLYAARKALGVLARQDDPAVAIPAGHLFEALAHREWLDARFGQQCLALMKRLYHTQSAHS